MVDAHLAQDRGVQVVDIDRVLGDVEAELVGPAEGDALLDSAAGEPDSKGLRMMVCLLYTSPSPRDLSTSRMPSSA